MAADWPITRLGEVAQLQRGLSYVAAQLRPPGRPFVTLKCFEKGGGFRWDGLKTFAGPATSEYELQGGELLIANTDLTRDASVVGAPALAPRFDGDPAVFSMDVSRLLTDPSRVDNKFLAFRLATQDARSFIQARSGGSTVLHLQLRGVPKFQFQLPPLPEQRQIAAVLDTLDEAIRKTEQIIAKLKQVKHGLLHDLLTRGIDDNGELRDPERHPEQFKDSPLGRIPREWEVAPLGRHLNGCGGYFQTGPFGSQLHSYEYSALGVPVVMPQDISNDGISADSAARIPEQVAARLGRHRMRKNDLLFARRGDLSRCASIDVREENWLCGTGCLLARLPEHSMASEWLAAAYRHDGLQRQIAGRAVGSTMANLNTGILQSLLLAIPSLDEQRTIATILRIHVERVEQETTELLKLRLLKAGLMEDLLTGRVRVTGLLAEAPA